MFNVYKEKSLITILSRKCYLNKDFARHTFATVSHKYLPNKWSLRYFFSFESIKNDHFLQPQSFFSHCREPPENCHNGRETIDQSVTNGSIIVYQTCGHLIKIYASKDKCYIKTIAVKFPLSNDSNFLTLNFSIPDVP